MRIATFNVENLAVKARSGLDLEARARILRPQLERLRADILCLQEIAGERTLGQQGRSLVALSDLTRGTRYQDYHLAAAGGPREDGIADVHNLAILSRLPITSQHRIRHRQVEPIVYRSHTSDPPAAAAAPVEFDRPLLLVEIATPAGPLHVVNVHLRSPLASSIPGQKLAPFTWKSVRGWAEGYFLSALKRSAQALELRFAVDDILDADAQALIAVCGDFNAQDQETPVTLAVGGEDDTGNGQLAGRSLVVVDRAIPADRRFTVLHHGRPQMLDHILASRRLMASLRGVECHNEVLADEVVGYDRIQSSPSSYHAPLVAEFELDPGV